MHWLTTRFRIPLDEPRVMGIVNVTPDSFSDGGRQSLEAVAHCERLLREGAHILDIGGESSRPGATPVSVPEELARVVPVLKAAVTFGVPVSVDTCKVEVMRTALDLGVDIINDITALRSEGAEALISAHPRCGVCLMHMRGDPQSMQQHTRYTDVVSEVRDFLGARLNRLREVGVEPERITLDPGIGFGKSAEDNFALLEGQLALQALGCPVLTGWSRKSALGAATGRPVGERIVASACAAVMAVGYGAKVVRVHDVAATVDALAVWRSAGLPRWAH